ncbi:MAG TPA: Gldg family protein [Blastocatellia bacterium]|nr:Gldg family protein [Blastocatellia bacterium]
MNLSRQDISKILGWGGVLLALIGYLVQMLTAKTGKLSWGLIIAGLVLAVAGLVISFGEIRESFGRRSTRLGANSALVTLAVIAILGFLNFLGYRYHKRVDLTSEQLYSLSDQTRKVVSGLQKDVKIYYFNRTDSVLRDMVEEYRDLNPRITYERIDIQARPEIAQQFGNPRVGDGIVVSGNKREKLAGTGGEQELTNAIMKVTRDAAKNICFIEGHGEKSIAGGGQDGYSVIAGALKNDNYETKTINLLTANEVPGDCSVVVIAGPKKAFNANETDAISKFLDGGGKVMIAADPDIELELGNLLKNWNIELNKDTVISDVIIPQLGRAAPIVLDYGTHAITKDFGKVGTVFPLARSIKTDTAKPEVTVNAILRSSEGSFGETELQGGAPPQLDESKDTKGPLTLGVAASKKVGDKEARLVVVGDSDFAANPYASLPSLANRDFFVNAVNWLAQDEDLIAIKPKSQTNRTITLDAAQNNLFFLLVVALPLAVLGAGVFIWWKRR